MKTCLAIVLLLIVFNGVAQPATVNRTDSTTNNCKIRIRCSSSLGAIEPLYIIDGVLVDGKALKSLRPDEIHSIDVLKDAKATSLYGNRGLSGVIIITTNNANTRRLHVLDDESGMPVEGATLQLWTGADSKIFTSNEKGEVRAEGFALKKNFRASLTCIGYEPREIDIRWNKAEDSIVIRMTRKISKLDEVRVVTFPTIICKRHTSTCRMATCGIARSGNRIEVEPRLPLNPSFIFPNPAALGGIVTIKAKPGLSKAELLNVNGQLLRFVMLNQEQHSFQFPLSAIGSGFYFLRMYNANGQPVDTQKLVIQ